VILGEVEWSNLTVAGAFVIGAALATFATIRVVRALSTMFADLEDRRRGTGGASRGERGASRDEVPPPDGTST